MLSLQTMLWAAGHQCIQIVSWRCVVLYRLVTATYRSRLLPSYSAEGASERSSVP